MDESKSPKPNPAPRGGLSLNHRQERFALAYVASLDKVEAIRQAGYRVNSDDAARDAASRLLRNPSVQAIIDREKAKVAKKFNIDAEGTVLRFQVVYLEAMRLGDIATALAALKELAKHYGVYDAHNRQKRITTQAEADAIRARLEMIGVDWRRKALVSSNEDGRVITNGTGHAATGDDSPSEN